MNPNIRMTIRPVTMAEVRKNRCGRSLVSFMIS